jgi:hypothetical protein
MKGLFAIVFLALIAFSMAQNSTPSSLTLLLALTLVVACDRTGLNLGCAVCASLCLHPADTTVTVQKQTVAVASPVIVSQVRTRL